MQHIITSIIKIYTKTTRQRTSARCSSVSSLRLLYTPLAAAGPPTPRSFLPRYADMPCTVQGSRQQSELLLTLSLGVSDTGQLTKSVSQTTQSLQSAPKRKGRVCVPESTVCGAMKQPHTSQVLLATTTRDRDSQETVSTS